MKKVKVYIVGWKGCRHGFGTISFPHRHIFILKLYYAIWYMLHPHFAYFRLDQASLVYNNFTTFMTLYSEINDLMYYMNSVEKWVKIQDETETNLLSFSWSLIMSIRSVMAKATSWNCNTQRTKCFNTILFISCILLSIISSSNFYFLN